MITPASYIAKRIAKPLPSPERLRELFTYEPETGVVTRLRTGGVGAKDASGYLAFYHVDGVKLYAHRVAWVLTFGEYPAGEIDHINGVKSDNRLSNLRAATRAQNSMNKPVRRDNRLGVKGVRRDYRDGKFVAQIAIDGRLICLGRFHRLEEAAAAYVKAAEEAFGEFARVK